MDKCKGTVQEANVRTLQNRAIKTIHKLPLLFPTHNLYKDVTPIILPINKMARWQSSLFINVYTIYIIRPG